MDNIVLLKLPLLQQYGSWYWEIGKNEVASRSVILRYHECFTLRVKEWSCRAICMDINISQVGPSSKESIMKMISCSL